MRELLREPVKEYTQFAAGLSFLPGLPPEEAVELLEERVRLLEEETREMRSRLDSAMEQYNLPRLFLVESEHELMLREAELGWVRGLVEDIEAGKLGDLSEWRSFHSEQGPDSAGEDGGGVRDLNREDPRRRCRHTSSGVADSREPAPRGGTRYPKHAPSRIAGQAPQDGPRRRGFVLTRQEGA